MKTINPDFYSEVKPTEEGMIPSIIKYPQEFYFSYLKLMKKIKKLEKENKELRKKNKKLKKMSKKLDEMECHYKEIPSPGSSRPWLQDAIVNTLPKVIELTTTVLSSKSNSKSPKGYIDIPPGSYKVCDNYDPKKKG